eukprot:g2166.t1
MCGIVAFLGKKPAAPILVEGLQRLEYRGYDSAGISTIENSDDAAKRKLVILKKRGKVKNLAQMCKDTNPVGTIGIGHTRWATHGEPSDRNSHPHSNMDQTIAVVHNGIIENYMVLKKKLLSEGIEFTSETDTEVLAHLVDSVRKNASKKTGKDVSLLDAVGLALSKVDGAYGICFLDKDDPDVLIGARMGSPLVLGIGQNGEYYLSSDASAFIAHTKKVVYLEDGDMVEIRRGKGHRIMSIEGSRFSFLEADNGGLLAETSTSSILEDAAKDHLSLVKREMQVLQLSLDQISKGGHKHYMIKEVLEQPQVLVDCMRGRVDFKKGQIQLAGVRNLKEKFAKAKRIIICACGTSWHSSLIGEYLIEDFARIPVEVEYASEFRYRRPILGEDDIVMCLSQSGETADTLAAVREAKKNDAVAFGIVNTVGSTIARETNQGIYLHVGPEIGVASTKAFAGQVMCLTMLAINLGYIRGVIPEEDVKEHVATLETIPELIKRVIEVNNDKIREMSKVYRYAHNFLYLGRGYNFPVALEGALKLKEISYIHAEGYPAAEMKHGPLALIDEFMPVVVICPSSDPTYEKTKANMQEVKARKGNIIVITDEGNTELDEFCDFTIHIPKVPEWAMPLLTVVPLQLMSYYIADMRGCSVDQPRNLAKSVTVE